MSLGVPGCPPSYGGAAVLFCCTGLDLYPPAVLAGKSVLIGPQFDSEDRHKPAAYVAVAVLSVTKAYPAVDA
jgi:hypothetical protein